MVEKEILVNRLKERLTQVSLDKIAAKAFELGLKYEATYWGCSQSTVLAVLDSLNLRDDLTFRAASGFGAGIGLTNKSTCGALIGSIMLIGLFFGRDIRSLENLDRGIKCYRISKGFVEAFENRFGDTQCLKIQKSLMGRAFNLWDEVEFALFEKSGGHKDKCPLVVAWSAKETIKFLYTQIEEQT